MTDRPGPIRNFFKSAGCPIGTVREVVARSLCDLERSGAIRVKWGQIQFLNEDLLRDWAQDHSHH